MLRTLHALACAENRNKYLKLGSWIVLLQSCGIIGAPVMQSVGAIVRP